MYKIDFKCNKKDLEDLEYKYNPPLDLMIQWFIIINYMCG